MDRATFLKIMGISPFLFGMNKINTLESLSQSLPLSERMPVLFLGHGNPMNALYENSFVAGFRNIASSIPTPKAILCISAHWLTNGTKVTAMDMPKTIHDFGGFPKELFEVQYPAKGSPSLAKDTQALLAPTSVDLDYDWGLDHGAWTVLKHLYPQANIPVIQMSIDYAQPAIYHFELASKLQKLRDRGILIVGSGNIIHNLGLVDFKHIDTVDYGFEWAHEAHQSINKHLLDHDFAPLVAFEKQSKAYQLAIPTPDHYYPMIYALGLKQKNESLNLFNDHLVAGSLSMTSFKIS